MQDDPTVQIVNNAQKAQEHYIQGDPIWPICRCCHAAPFKVGGRKNDPASFVEVERPAHLP